MFLRPGTRTGEENRQHKIHKTFVEVWRIFNEFGDVCHLSQGSVKRECMFQARLDAAPAKLAFTPRNEENPEVGVRTYTHGVPYNCAKIEGSTLL